MARLDEKVKSLIAVALSDLLIAFCLLSLPAPATDAQGVLESQLKDHREAIDDFAKLNITIDKILISPKPGLKFWQTRWKELKPSSAAIDLTQFVGKKTARAAIESGSFDAFHLKSMASSEERNFPYSYGTYDGKSRHLYTNDKFLVRILPA